MSETVSADERKLASEWPKFVRIVVASPYRLTLPEVARYLVETTIQLADLLGISISEGEHKG